MSARARKASHRAGAQRAPPKLKQALKPKLPLSGSVGSNATGGSVPGQPKVRAMWQAVAGGDSAPQIRSAPSGRADTSITQATLTTKELEVIAKLEKAASAKGAPQWVDVHIVNYRDPRSTHAALQIIARAAQDGIPVTLGFAGIRTPTPADAQSYLPTFSQAVPVPKEGAPKNPLIILPNGSDLPVLGGVLDALRAGFNGVHMPGVPLANEVFSPSLQDLQKDTTSQFGVAYRLVQKAMESGATLNGVAHSNGVAGLTGVSGLLNARNWDNVTLLEGNATAGWFREMTGRAGRMNVSTSRNDPALKVAILGGQARGAQTFAGEGFEGKLNVVIGDQPTHSAFVALALLQKAHPDLDLTRHSQAAPKSGQAPKP
jgi:hypothetical protein